MNDERGQRKAERNYYANNPLQRCIVCGRLFVRRKGNVCSIDCQRKAEKDQTPRKSMH